MKKYFLRLFYFTLLFGSNTFLPPSSVADPADKYRTQLNCWNNYNFITPQDLTYRYCIQENGRIHKMDSTGNILKEKIFIDKEIKIKKNISNYPFDLDQDRIQSKSKTTIYTIFDDQLLRFSCKSKKVDRRKYLPTDECTKSIIGIRPKEYYYDQGIKSQEFGNWLDSIDDFNKHIAVSDTNEIYYFRALSKYKINDFVGSLKDINKAIELSPEFLYSYNLRSLIRHQLNDYQGEIKDLTTLIKLLETINQEGRNNLENLSDLPFNRRGRFAYLLVDGPTWNQAKQNAKKIGGRLVIINDNKENEWITRTFASSNLNYNKQLETSYWIGSQYFSNYLSKNSTELTTYQNWDVGSPSNYSDFSSAVKITLYSISEDNKFSSGKWHTSSLSSFESFYGIAEVNIATKLEEIDSQFSDIYYRRGIARSELSDVKGAIKDFDQEINNNPTNALAYIARGKENYWMKRDSACNDLFKGRSLGAKDSSYYSFIDDCRPINSEKIQRVKANTRSELILENSLYLIKKSYILLPVFLIVIFYIVMKSKETDDS